MIPSGLTSAVIHRASLGNGYVRVRDSGPVAAVAQLQVQRLTIRRAGAPGAGRYSFASCGPPMAMRAAVSRNV